MGEGMDVAVVGGGPAGLAAAWTVVSAGGRATVYERDAEPGGRLRTDALGGGSAADMGVQLLASRYGETLALAREAGLADLLVRAPGRDALWRRGRAHVITYGSVASMVASGALPASLKLRMAARYLPFLRRHARSLDVNEPVGAAADGLDGESIATWGLRELGEEFVELLAYPVLASYYAARPEETSAGFYHALARAGLEVSVIGLRGGAAAFARGLLSAVEAAGGRAATGVEVTAVAVEGAGVEVRWPGGGARHDAAVLAVPPAAALSLAQLPSQATTWLESVPRVPVSSLALLLDGPVGADWFGLSFPRTEPPGDVIGAICAQSAKGTGLVTEGRGVLVVYPAPSVADRVAAASPEAALELLLPGVELAMPGIRRRVVSAWLRRFPGGGSLFPPGYLTRLAGFNPAWTGPRLALAGDWLVAPTVEGAVRSGRRAARRVVEGG